MIKLSCYHHHNLDLCIHVDLTTLADGPYKLVPESESEQCEAQVNLTKIAEDLNESSKEPRLAPLRKASPGACPIYFKFMQLLIFISTCAFKFVGIVWNLSYMILGTYA